MTPALVEKLMAAFTKARQRARAKVYAGMVTEYDPQQGRLDAWVWEAEENEFLRLLTAIDDREAS